MLAQISQRLGDCPPSERRVGEWVLAHPRRATRSTLRELAELCGSSEPTIVRFCRRLGTSGYREFTLRLTEALSRPAGYVHRDVSADDDPADAVAKVLDASIAALTDVRRASTSLPLEETLGAMRRARQLVFAGLGASGHVAADARHKFFRLGTPASVLSDTPDMLQFAAIAEPGDVLFFISAGGRWPDVVRAARHARDRGATVLALTDPESALAEAADIVLPCRAAEDTSIFTPMSSRLAHLAILDALQVALALAIGEPAGNRLRASKDAIALPSGR